MTDNNSKNTNVDSKLNKTFNVFWEIVNRLIYVFYVIIFCVHPIILKTQGLIDWSWFTVLLPSIIVVSSLFILFMFYLCLFKGIDIFHLYNKTNYKTSDGINISYWARKDQSNTQGGDKNA